jgi:hypothetical protein
MPTTLSRRHRRKTPGFYGCWNRHVCSCILSDADDAIAKASAKNTRLLRVLESPCLGDGFYDRNADRRIGVAEEKAHRIER